MNIQTRYVAMLPMKLLVNFRGEFQHFLTETCKGFPGRICWRLFALTFKLRDLISGVKLLTACLFPAAQNIALQYFGVGFYIWKAIYDIYNIFF